MATPEEIERVRQGCIARLFSGRDDASWEEIGEALRSLEGIAVVDPWGVDRDNLANFCYGEPKMPHGAERIIEEMTGFQI